MIALSCLLVVLIIGAVIGLQICAIRTPEDHRIF
jgi:hypothetical protein